MGIQLANRALSIKPSPTIAVTSKARELRASGRDIISLGAGEPDFDTPAHIAAAAKEAIDNGHTRYTAVGGTPELKQAILNKFKRDNKLIYKPEQVLVSCGAKQSIYNLCQAILNPGDEVIIPAPYWVSYPDIAILAEAKPVVINAGIEQNFKITPEQLEQAITKKTKLFTINSPSNPTGVAYTAAELKALAAVLIKHPNIIIATDDIYEHIYWGNEPFSNLVTVCPELYPQTIVINGVSKAYAMTGWRIGYAAGDIEIIKAMSKIQGQSTSNPCSVSQKASEVALNGSQHCIKDMVKAFKERHDYVLEQLNSIDGIECTPADGTFYLFFKASGLIKKIPEVNDCVQLSEYLLERAEIALVPGSAFGAPGYQRLSFATSMEILESAMQRLKQIA